MQQGDAEAGTGVLEAVGSEHGAVVHVELSGEAPSLQGVEQAVAEGVGILAQVELGVGDEAGVVVDEGEEIALSEPADVDYAGAVEAIGLPQVVGELGFEASAILGRCALSVEAVALEDAVDALNGHLFVAEDVAAAGFFEQHRYADLGELAAQVHQGELALGVEHTAFTLVAAFVRFEALDGTPAPLVA